MASTQVDRTRAHPGDLPTSVSRLGLGRIAWALLAAVVLAGFGEATLLEEEAEVVQGLLDRQKAEEPAEPGEEGPDDDGDATG